MNTTKSKQGFTIIEVVLVLAIAALIFLMIFVALPALQRGQANTARKNDVGSIATAISNYRSNTNGKLPTASADIDKYINDLAQVDSTSIGFASGAGTLTADESGLDKAKIFVKAKCSTDGQAAVSGTGRQAAVITILETSGSKYAAFCQNA